MTAIAKEPNYSAFIAIDKGNAVGFIGTRIGPRFEGDGLYGQIMILIVTAKYRRKGVGLQLLKKAESELATHKASTVVVNTAEFRSDAQAFYEAAGYRYTGRRYRKEYLTNK
jgi:ribosomal protein S18 acetylase RimI-like enzyme